MKPLFWRILLLLLGAFSVTIIIGYFLFKWISHELEPSDTSVNKRTRTFAEQVVQFAEKGELTRIRHDFRERYKMRIWVIDSSGRTLGKKPVPPDLERQINRYPVVIRPHQNPLGRFFLYGHEVQGVNSDQFYRVIMSSPLPPHKLNPRSWFLIAPIAIFILAVVAASVLLSYWILRPIRAFSETTKSISPSDLSSRISESITGRKDAFGNLARDFNAMADRVERTVERQKQLLRDVSHELRTPLTRIQLANSLSIKKRGQLPESDRIEMEVNRLDDLIGDLLALSRAESSVHLQTSSVMLNSLLDGLIEDVNFEYKEKNRKAKLFGEANVRVVANEKLLRRAIENVLRNAMRHTPEDTLVEIDISKGRGETVISITDQGEGIPEGYLDRIFDPFFRTDDSRHGSNKQHGIGLALSRSIIKSHGGLIDAENIESAGLRVTISIPDP